MPHLLLTHRSNLHPQIVGPVCQYWHHMDRQWSGLDYPLLSLYCKCPDVLLRTAMSHTHTTAIGTINGGPISTVIGPECQSTSPLVGLDPATHSGVLSSTDREGGSVTYMHSRTNSATCSLGVSGELPARGTGDTVVCHIQVDHTSPAYASTRMLGIHSIYSVANTLQLVCEVVQQVLIELQALT